MNPIILLLFFLISSLCQPTPKTIRKSPQDPKSYHTITLSNSIECLLISDPKTDMSAAVVSVGVGSLQDPWDRQGLSHFLEHVLFQSNSKYPKENQLINFVLENSGSFNGYTYPQKTSYYFQIPNTLYPLAMDRLASILTSPLFNQTLIVHQLQIIESQHASQFNNDTQRKEQIMKILTKEGHDLRKYNFGSKEFLGNGDIADAMKKYYEGTYSANLMKAVLYGNGTVDELGEMAKVFEQIPNKNYERYRMKEMPYGKESLSKIIKIVPVQDIKLMQIVWILPDKSIHYRNPPGSYVSYILNQEGKGSLADFLKKLGLILNINVKPSNKFRLYSELKISFHLTEKGVQNYQQILSHLFFFLQALQTTPPQAWLHSQLNSIKKINFLYNSIYQQYTNLLNYINDLAMDMQEIQKISDVLVWRNLMEQWKPDIIREYLEQLGQGNVMVFLQAKQVEAECLLEEPVYKTKYGVFQLGNVSIKGFPLKFPQKNPFIPTDFTLRALGTQTTPKLLHNTSKFQIYYKQDHKFATPHIFFTLRFYFNGTFSARDFVIQNIYRQMLAEKVKELVKTGAVGSAVSKVQLSSYCSIDFIFHGVRESVLKFVKPFLSSVLQFSPQDPTLFHNVLPVIQTINENNLQQDPMYIALQHLMTAITQGIYPSPKEQLAEINKGIKIEDIIKFANQWKKKLFVEGFLGGNLGEEDAIGLVKEVEGVVGDHTERLSISEIGQSQVLNLTSEYEIIFQHILLKKQQKGSSVLVYFQQGIANPRTVILLDLTSQLLKPVAFDYFRTKEQLGFSVHLQEFNIKDIHGIVLLIKSQSKTTYELCEYIDNFLQKVIPTTLQQLPSQKFLQSKHSLHSLKSSLPETLALESSNLASEIFTHSYNYNRKQKQVEQIDKITLEDFRKFVKKFLLEDVRKVEVHEIVGQSMDRNQEAKRRRLARQAEQKKKVKYYTDVKSFKKDYTFFPDQYKKTY